MHRYTPSANHCFVDISVAKASAKTLSAAVKTGYDSTQKNLEHLDKSYDVDVTDKLDIDLAPFLDYIWRENTPLEQFFAEFNSRLDRIASLNIDTQLKGHLFLRQAVLALHSRNIIVGDSSGGYGVTCTLNALRQAYRHTSKRGTQSSSVAEMIDHFVKRRAI